MILVSRWSPAGDRRHAHDSLHRLPGRCAPAHENLRVDGKVWTPGCGEFQRFRPIVQHTTALSPESYGMNAIDLIRRLHQYRMWTNRQLRDCARLLTAAQLLQPFPIGQGSVWKSLTHLYAAEYVWMEALHGNEQPLVPGDAPGKMPGNQEAEGAMSDLNELLENWQELDRRWEDYLSRITDECLDQVVFKISTSSALGKRLGTRLADVLLHVCTHDAYTTAQVVNMLRHLGVPKLPDLMLISLARQEVAKGVESP